MYTRNLGAVVASLTIVLCSAVHAQETLDTSVSHLSGAHDLARNTQNDSFLVAWAGEGAGHEMEIRAHRLVPSGRQTGTTITVDESNLTSTEVSVAYGNGRYLIVWRDGRKISSRGDEIYGRILDTSGNLLGDSFRISDMDNKGPDTFPDVVYDGHRFLVVWAHRHLNPSGGFIFSFVENDDVRGRYVTVEGEQEEGSFAFTEEAVDSQRPAVASVSGSPLVVWEDHPGPGTPGQIWGARTPQNVSNHTSFPYSIGSGVEKGQPTIIANPDQEQFLILWRSEIVNLGSFLHARLATPQGKYIGKTRIVTGVDGGLNTFSAAYDATRKNYLISWDIGVKESAGHIRAVRLDPSTLETKDKFQITEGETRNWGVVSDPTGEEAPLSVYLRKGKGESVELVSGRMMTQVVTEESSDDDSGKGACSASATQSTPSPIPFLLMSLVVIALLISPILLRGRSKKTML